MLSGAVAEEDTKLPAEYFSRQLHAIKTVFWRRCRGIIAERFIQGFPALVLFSGAGLSKDISPSQLHHQLVLTPKLGEVAPT